MMDSQPGNTVHVTDRYMLHEAQLYNGLALAGHAWVLSQGKALIFLLILPRYNIHVVGLGYHQNCGSAATCSVTVYGPTES